MVIFDYQSPTDFKFAGAYVGSNRWLIGHRTSSLWLEDTNLTETILPGVDYDLRVVIEGTDQVTLSVDGVPKLSYQFATDVTDGAVGVGTRDAMSRFDNVSVKPFVPAPPPPPATLPMTEDFTDGVADHFRPQFGGWDVSDGQYHVHPIPGVTASARCRRSTHCPTRSGSRRRSAPTRPVRTSIAMAC